MSGMSPKKCALLGWRKRVKVLTVVGARPQFVKAAAVSKVFGNTDGVNEVIVHTGQHYDATLSEVFFSELNIPAPAHNLGIGSGLHGAQTGQMLASLEQVILDEQPDWLLVYGDTNSTLAGALAAAKLHVPVAHVEAGLRSFNRRMPEEINRIATDHLSALLFTPTATATRNLANEGISGANVVEVGDVMYDAALNFRQVSNANDGVLNKLQIRPGGYVLATVHRAENTDAPDRLRAILEGLRVVAEQMDVILPLHPRTRSYLRDSGINYGNIKLVDPVGYLDMLELEANARLIATDSGGVQKEAYFHRVPCVTLRDETEWVELVESGWNRLQPPTSAAEVGNTILARLDSKGDDVQLYGGGRASEGIVDHLLRHKPSDTQEQKL